MDLSARGISLEFDPHLGILNRFVVERDGRDIAPLHRAPWVGSDEVFPDGTDPHLTRLQGDFFCAPFGDHEDGSPFHGWPPNSQWEATTGTDTTGVARLRATLVRPVRGARLTKTLLVRDDHPFVYQHHEFEGGEGEISVANHANVSVASGALISASPKKFWVTPGSAPETDPTRGRSILSYPAHATDPRAFPASEGTVDLTSYPWGEAHEDFVVAVEAAQERGAMPIGWTAVVRPLEGDVFLSVRNTTEAPMTMFWHSNGGRDYPPWSGRHFGCLGVEEGAAWQMIDREGEIRFDGQPALALQQGGRVGIRHVIGAVEWPFGTEIETVEVKEDFIRLVDRLGNSKEVPFWTEFLK